MDFGGGDSKGGGGSGGTKRRRIDVITSGMGSRREALSRRLTRLSKTIKATNPAHMFYAEMSTQADFSTTGGIYDCATGIAQGDAYNQRFGNKIIPKRVNLKASVVPDSTGTGVVTCRVSIVRGTSALGVGPTVSLSISPVGNTNILQVYYDKVFTCTPGLTAAASPGWATTFNISVPIKLNHLKFNGSGAGANVAESIFLIWSSNAATGTAAPNWGAGIVEFFYIP